MIDDAADFDNQDPAGGDDAGGGAPPDDLIGAYLLDALTEEERADFEAHLRTSEAARREVVELRPVVDLLPLTLQAPRDDPSFAEVAPSAGLRERILAAARAEGVGDRGGDESADEPSASVPAPAPTPMRRPAGRRSGARSEAIPHRHERRRPAPGVVAWIDRVGWSRLAAATFALIAAGALIWALTLRDRLDETEGELANAARTATAAAATATGGEGVQALAYILTPTADGPETGGGVLFPQPEDPTTASLSVIGMPALAEGEVYQLWFVEFDAQGNPAVTRPSVTFGVDEAGNASADVPLPAEPFDVVALTREPAGAVDDQPTLPILMTGAPGTAAG